MNKYLSYFRRRRIFLLSALCVVSLIGTSCASGEAGARQGRCGNKINAIHVASIFTANSVSSNEYRHADIVINVIDIPDVSGMFLVHYYSENAAPYTEYLSIVDKDGNAVESFYEVGASCSGMSFERKGNRRFLRYNLLYRGKLKERVEVDITDKLAD